MKARTTRPFTAYVGIDWADTKHDICLQAAGDDRREFDCIPHQVARIDEWAKSLHTRFGGPIAIALELAKGPIVYARRRRHNPASDRWSTSRLGCGEGII